MISQYKERYLDLGGLTEDDESVLERLALQYPQGLFYIVDPKAKLLTREVSQNLIISAPEIRKFIGFVTKYRIPYPNDFFTDARMDAVLDFMDYTYAPILLLRTLNEIKRVLQPNGVLTVVDLAYHRKGLVPACRILGFHDIRPYSYQELAETEYPMSSQIEAFHGLGFPVFGLQARK